MPKPGDNSLYRGAGSHSYAVKRLTYELLVSTERRHLRPQMG
jgi:hypothetical protein